ncbi:MAG: 2-amino-4-hydroxy-6-hydroxymethyldihydropteridine diphosphokinase [Bacteroidota bacterium]
MKGLPLHMLFQEIYLQLGTNLGDREHHLAEAKKRINYQLGTINRTSSIYETAAWGRTDQPAFLNQVVALESHWDPWTMMKTILEIEEAMGRIREEKWGPRVIDIDLLAHGQNRIVSALLSLPHPELPNRKFVLVPLQEIAPNWKHPSSGKSINELLENTPDQLEVNILGIE